MMVILAIVFFAIICALMVYRVYLDQKTGCYPKWFTQFFMIAFGTVGVGGTAWLLYHYFIINTFGV